MYTFISKYWNVPFILCQYCPILGHYSQGLEHSSTILEHRYVPSSIAWHCIWSRTFFHLKFKGRHKLIQSSLLYYYEQELLLMTISKFLHSFCKYSVYFLKISFFWEDFLKRNVKIDTKTDNTEIKKSWRENFKNSINFIWRLVCKIGAVLYSKNKNKTKNKQTNKQSWTI